MAGRELMPLSVIIGGGKSHLTKAEIEDRRQAEAKLRPATDKIRCPAWLGDEARKEWRRIVKDLQGVGLMTNIDVTSLAIYCDAYGKYLEASKKVEIKGVVTDYTNAAGATNQVPHPGVAVMQRMAQLIKSFGAEFGLSPGARLRLVVPKEPPKELTELEKNGFGDV